MSPAIEFDRLADQLVLRYTSRDDNPWVGETFKEGKPVLIKGTYRFSDNDLLPADSPVEDGDLWASRRGRRCVLGLAATIVIAISIHAFRWQAGHSMAI